MKTSSERSNKLIKAGRIALLFLAVAACDSLTAAEELSWRELDPDNTVFLDMAEGRVVIELNPLFAPATVRQFKKLVQDRFYDGLAFYRVIDGFVAQGGDGSDLGALSNLPLIDAEFEIEWNDEFPFVPVQAPDMFAPETGLVDGFAVARDTAQASWPWREMMILIPVVPIFIS